MEPRAPHSESNAAHPESDVIASLVSGSLDAETRQRVLAHIEECGECSDVLAALLRGDAPNPASDRIGDVIAGRYEIIAPLGAGGMGTVYAAFDRELRVDVAVKGIAQELRSKPEIEALLKREIVLSRRVLSRHVCRVHELLRDGPDLFIVMERIHGETLAARLARGKMSSAQSKEIVLGLAEGLADIHRAGIVHRDIKPSNVMLDDERVVLMDFGLSREVDATSALSLVDGGGTPAYWAPEQSRGQRANERSDIYALGRLLQEVMSACDDAKLRRQMDVVIGIATRSDPNDRFDNGDALRAAIEQALSTKDQSRVVLGVILGALLVIAAAWGWLRNANDEPHFYEEPAPLREPALGAPTAPAPQQDLPANVLHEKTSSAPDAAVSPPSVEPSRPVSKVRRPSKANDSDIVRNF